MENGVLTEYKGKGGAVVCEGVEFLHPGCLRNSPVITLPSSLRYIADKAIDKQAVRKVNAPNGLPKLEQFWGVEWLFLSVEDTRNPAFDEAAIRWVRRNAKRLSREVVRRGSMIATRKLLSCYRRVSLPLLDGMLEEAAASGQGEIAAMLMTVKAALYPPDKIARMERNAEQRAWEKTEPSLADWRKTFRIRTKNGEAVITGYKSDDPVVVIPARIAGYRVVAVGEQAFRCRWHVTSLTVEEGVRELGHHAFAYCTALKEVHLPKGIVIHHTAFYGTRIDEAVRARHTDVCAQPQE